MKATANTYHFQKHHSDAGRLKARAIGVQFTDENGRHHQAFLNSNKDSEIIVSAGAIGTPQLLLLSGIGPKNDLKNHNIPVVLHNKYVGKGMADNPMNSIFIPTRSPPRQSLIETVGITEEGVFIEASSGFGQSSESVHCHHGIMSAEVWHLSCLQFQIAQIYFFTSFILHFDALCAESRRVKQIV